MEQQWKKQHPSQHQHPTVGILFTMHHPEKKQYVAVKAFPNTFEKGKTDDQQECAAIYSAGHQQDNLRREILSPVGSYDDNMGGSKGLPCGFVRMGGCCFGCCVTGMQRGRLTGTQRWLLPPTVRGLAWRQASMKRLRPH